MIFLFSFLIVRVTLKDIFVWHGFGGLLVFKSQ